MDYIGIVQYGNGNPNISNVYFYGECIQTLVTNKPSEVVDWINEIENIHLGRLQRLIVGLDVEWRPSYSEHRNPVAILQLCVGHRCLIFQILHCSDIPNKLDRFLDNPYYTFVGVGIHGDVEKLSIDYFLDVTNAVDLCTLAAEENRDRSLRNAGLKRLALVFMGADIEKPRRVTMSDWDQAWLTSEQIKYACVDAFVSFKIGMILNASVHSD